MAVGRLIVVVGIDGCGKSTLVRRLASSPGIVVSREPTDGPHGRTIRAAFAAGKRLPPEEERALFQADRRAHVGETIRPAIARGQTVLLDRYYYCTAAYQGADAADAVSIVHENERFAPRPQVVVFLQLPAAFALARLQARGSLTGPENYETLRDVAERYETLWRTPALMDGMKMVRINALQSPEVIEAQVRAACGLLLEDEDLAQESTELGDDFFADAIHCRPGESIIETVLAARKTSLQSASDGDGTVPQSR